MNFSLTWIFLRRRARFIFFDGESTKIQLLPGLVELHWLDVPERIKYKLSMMTRRCLNGTAPQYLAAHCVPVSATASRQHLRSAASHQLVIPSYWLSSYGRRSFSVAGPATWNVLPRFICMILYTLFQFLDDYSRLNTFGRRAFAVAGPMSWNSLPNSLRESACDDNISDCFKHSLKTFLFSGYWRTERSRGVYDSALYKCTFTCLLLTYYFSSQSTSAYSTLGTVLALMRYISRHFTYLLTLDLF